MVEDRLRLGLAVEPIVVLDGAWGSAVVRIVFEDGVVAERSIQKAGLMATAFEASTCLVVLPVLHWTSGASIKEAVLILRATSTASAATLWSVSASRLVPLGDLVTPAVPLSDLEAEFAGLLPVSRSERDRVMAWRQLEALGVSIDRHERIMH